MPHILDEIIAYFDGPKAFADKLNVTPQVFYNWRVRGFAPWAAIDIEKLSGGKFKAVSLPVSYSLNKPTTV